MNSLGSHDSLVVKYDGESRLPSGEYTGKLITNTYNFSNIQKNLKSFLGMSSGTGRGCLITKKPESINVVTLFI
jgi:hypothetical protein